MNTTHADHVHNAEMSATCRCLICGWTAAPGTDSPSPASQQVSACYWAPRGGDRGRNYATTTTTFPNFCPVSAYL